jgi:hypothetical protein
MKNRFLVLSLLTILVFTLSCVKSLEEGSPSPWQHPLYMANNDYWRQRIPVDIRNNTDIKLMGDPLEIQIGNSQGQAPLVGVKAEGIRVTTASGSELTFRVSDRDGNLIERGPIPENSIITVPVECDADTLTTNFIYFDNPSAWAIGDFYKTHREVYNGGLEKETRYGPLGWDLDLPDINRKVECVTGEGHTGNRSIKVTASSEKITTPLDATQQNLHLLSGVSYILEGWVKAENVKGDARIAVILGNSDSEDFKLGSEKVSCGTGTYDWKKVTLKFTVPENVTGARIQTLVEGTGTAWFDDITLSCKKDYNITATVMKAEKLALKEIGKTDTWFDDNTNDQNEWQSRAAIKTINFDNQKSVGKLVCVGIEGVLHRLHAEVSKNAVFQVTDGINPIPYYKMGNYVFFKQDIPASTEQTNYIYLSSGAKPGEGPMVTEVNNLNELGKNLILNPDFEGNNIAGWKSKKESGDIKVSTKSKEGSGSVQLQIAPGQGEKEISLEQTLPVTADKLYFFSAWIKCSDLLEEPDFLAGIRQRTLKAQFITKEGKAIGRLSRIAVNPERHTDNEWSQLFLLLKTPEGADSVKLQLVNSAPGTVWFDDLVFTDVISGVTSALAIERKAAKDLKELTVWQEDPIVKVFQDDLPPEITVAASISVARNEAEPLQLVVRSPKEYKQLQIKVNPPTDMKGNKLEQVEIGVVGYVPINYPSNYINDRVTPYWRQKIPFGNSGSDGWIGMWPDPILPFQSFDLSANTSQPLWIEFNVPKNAVPGDYSGKVQLVQNSAVIKEIPFKVHVRDFALTNESHVVAEYDARINNWNFIGNAKSETERMKEIWKMLADHRLCPDALTPAPTWKIENGKIVFDLTEFDKSASYYFNDLKLNRVYSPWYFYLFGWANLPDEKFGEKPYPGEFPYPGVDRSKLRPEFKKAYQTALRIYWNHMKEKGWANKVVFYVSDEPHADAEITVQMRALCNMIHEVDPKIPIYVSTWWYRPEYKGYVDVWGVSNHGGGWGRPVPVTDLINIKKIGGRLFFTTDGKMCTDTPYLGFERMLPYFCFKYGAEEYEFWGSNWYTFNPYEYGWHSFIRQSDRPGDLYWIRYPNGDANFIYPGEPIGVNTMVATIRLKLAREGVEDYEYLYSLDSLITLGRKKGKDVNQAEKALESAKQLVTIPSAEGRYSTEYLPDPYIVLRVREQVAEAIEGLLK